MPPLDDGAPGAAAGVACCDTTHVGPAADITSRRERPSAAIPLQSYTLQGCCTKHQVLALRPQTPPDTSTLTEKEMRTSHKWLVRTLFAMMIPMGLTGRLPAQGTTQGVVNYACSNQVYASFSGEHTKAFTDETGINVKLTRGSSSHSISEVLNGRAEVASSARELDARQRMVGLREFPFCAAPLALITKAGCGIENATKDQIASIFTGAVRNWTDVGGPDLAIIVVIPSEETAAHRNFRREIGPKSLVYDFAAYASTGVIDLVRQQPCGAVSFISYGAVNDDPAIKALRIDGLAPIDTGYPYNQTMRLVTRNELEPPVQAFVDYVYSPRSRSLIEKHGMVPLPRQAESK